MSAEIFLQEFLWKILKRIFFSLFWNPYKNLSRYNLSYSYKDSFRTRPQIPPDIFFSVHPSLFSLIDSSRSSCKLSQETLLRISPVVSQEISQTFPQKLLLKLEKVTVQLRIAGIHGASDHTFAL